MKIACIGWGSLIWRPESLKIQNVWFTDGPLLPIEFVRESNDQRITLVIDSHSFPVRTLWALMTTQNLNEAIESLKEREGLPSTRKIDSVKASEEANDPIKIVIKEWLINTNLDAAVWTGLGCKFNDTNTRPTVDQVIEHLNGLDYQAKQVAEEYIRKAPKQIDTVYRRKLEERLGWTRLEN